jgi:hypothetical protein
VLIRAVAFALAGVLLLCCLTPLRTPTAALSDLAGPAGSTADAALIFARNIRFLLVSAALSFGLWRWSLLSRRTLSHYSASQVRVRRRAIIGLAGLVVVAQLNTLSQQLASLAAQIHHPPALLPLVLPHATLELLALILPIAACVERADCTNRRCVHPLTVAFPAALVLLAMAAAVEVLVTPHVLQAIG